MKRVSIIGIGWLGRQMAEKLLEMQVEVWGTTTSGKRAAALNSAGIEAVVYDLKTDFLDQTHWEKISQSEYLILTVPPSGFGETYAAFLIGFLEKLHHYSSSIKIIYTGSISVYGNATRVVDERSTVDPQSQNAKQLSKVEHFLMENFEYAFIWRMGGLVGPKRHPVKYLAGREGISKANAPVNLIHVEDIGEVMMKYVKGEWRYPILNLCAPDHPTKEKFYTQVAKNLKLSLPIFDERDQSRGKTVDSKHIKALNHSFIYASPYDFPQSKNEA